MRVYQKTGDVGAEEGGEAAGRAGALTFVAELVVQDVGFHFHLQTDRDRFAVRTRVAAPYQSIHVHPYGWDAHGTSMGHLRLQDVFRTHLGRPQHVYSTYIG